MKATRKLLKRIQNETVCHEEAFLVKLLKERDAEGNCNLMNLDEHMSKKDGK